MSRSRLSIICMSIAACLVALPLAIVSAVERGVAFVFAWLSPAAYRPALDTGFGDRLVAFAGDCPVAPAVSNALRHEAGMRRLT